MSSSATGRSTTSSRKPLGQCVAYTDRLGAARQKAFSHKVRFGCITCKRRRVKCDENKPHCLNCTRGNRECLGYSTPKPKVFILQCPKDSSSDQTSYPSLSQLSDSPSSTEELPMVRPPKASFGSDEETNYLQHWLCVTSPWLSHYSPEGDFFTVVVPQFAWQSPAVKHMLVALSMTHCKFQSGVTSVPKSTTSRALTHYVSAITDIRKNNPSKLEVVVASLIAWVLELMQNNIPAALTHLRATFRLLQAHKQFQLSGSVVDLVQNSLAPTASLAKGLTSLMLQSFPRLGEIEPQYRDHIHSPWEGPAFSSLVEARRVVCDYIVRIAVAKNEDEVQQAEILLSYWWETIRRWDQESARSPDMTALLLLMNIGMALLPGSDVAGFSYSENPHAIKSVVDSAARLLPTARNFDHANDQLRDTLRMALTFAVRLFPKDINRGRAGFLLEQLGDKW